MSSPPDAIDTDQKKTSHLAADESSAAAGADAQPHVASRGLLREYFESGVVTLIMAFFFMTFVAQAAEVPSASMQNTIYVGDHFLINKFIFASGPTLPFLPQREIRRGDIVVFKYPAKSERDVKQYETLFIKRVIGLPGDTVEARGGDILINGQLLPEHRVAAEGRLDKAPLEIISDPPRKPGEQSYTVFYTPETLNARPGSDTNVAGIFKYATGKPYRVPEASYFVMGDNRDDSLDSRAWGVVPRELVVGRAMFVIWSYDESAPSSGNFIIDFFKNTRWSRTGTLIK